MSVYLSNKRCEVNKDGSRKGHIEVNAKAEVPLGYDGIIEYEVKKANGVMTSGKCRITNINGVVNVSGPNDCPFFALNDNTGVKCIPSGGVVDYIFNVGDELLFVALSINEGSLKDIIDNGDNKVGKSSKSVIQTLVADGNGGWKPVKYFPNLTGYSTASLNNTCILMKIGSRPFTSGHYNAQFASEFVCGMHNKVSFSGKFKFTFVSSDMSKSRLSIFTFSPDTDVTDSPKDGYKKFEDCFTVKIYCKIENGVATFYLAVKGEGTTAYIPRITMLNILGDEDWTWEYGVKNPEYAATDFPEDTTYGTPLGSTVVYQTPSIPAPPSSGTKTLKSVDGVIQWA